MDSQQKKSERPQLDIYQLVTDNVLSLLEKGVVPWQKPWAETGPPRNLLSKREYRGINFWVLNALDYAENYFLTFEQVKAVGGSIMKDEKGHMVVFWKNIARKPEELDDKGNPVVIPMLRYYKVFNITQCRDIPKDLVPQKKTDVVDLEPIEMCEEVLNDMPSTPDLTVKGKHAYYEPAIDRITMPPLKQFKTKAGYYGTLFHEIIHSTGHTTRLNRKGVTDCKPFGTPDYSMEELIAEFGAAYLSQYCGIGTETISNSASYIKEWSSVLKNDKRFIIHAAGSAQKATDYVLNVQAGHDDKDREEEPVDESVVS